MNTESDLERGVEMPNERYENKRTPKLEGRSLTVVARAFLKLERTWWERLPLLGDAFFKRRVRAALCCHYPEYVRRWLRVA